GRPRLLEINPRASGGVAMSCLSGINLPYLALRGFVDGYDGLAIPPARFGQRVTEVAVAISLPTRHAQ
ncbi:MAG: ATP-grasp domain-containing protein, partial [Pseudoxanthomonas sp.]